LRDVIRTLAFSTKESSAIRTGTEAEVGGVPDPATRETVVVKADGFR
jgi:hypothetical protein